MLITEQLLLLLRSDDGSAESGTPYPAYGMVGALLADFALLAAVAPAHKILADESRGMSKTELTARTEAISAAVEADGALPEAVRRAVASANAAITAGVTAAIGASVAASSQ